MHIVRNVLIGTAALLLMTSAAFAVQTAALDAAAPQPAPQSLGTIVMAPMALNSLSNPPAQIATAPVADENGTVVGAGVGLILHAIVLVLG